MPVCFNKKCIQSKIKRNYSIQILPFYYIFAQKNPQRPILPFSIVGAEVLNFCVRDGNRCIHFAIVTNLNIEK